MTSRAIDAGKLLAAVGIGAAAWLIPWKMGHAAGFAAGYGFGHAAGRVTGAVELATLEEEARQESIWKVWRPLFDRAGRHQG